MNAHVTYCTFLQTLSHTVTLLFLLIAKGSYTIEYNINQGPEIGQIDDFTRVSPRCRCVVFAVVIMLLLCFHPT